MVDTDSSRRTGEIGDRSRCQRADACERAQLDRRAQLSELGAFVDAEVGARELLHRVSDQDLLTVGIFPGDHVVFLGSCVSSRQYGTVIATEIGYLAHLGKEPALVIDNH